MSQSTFYWHDYETWGVNPRLDRPAQFAGIRTDAELNIIGEPLMMYACPTSDFLPSPEAVLITGITPQKALAEGVTEAEFFKRIHQQFSRAATCVVGYNNIRFDDEVSRFGFYRNFYDPYAYSWQNGNSRWDVLDLMRLAHALRPQGINWPTREDDGLTSFKLTDLTAANDIEQVGAHDALVDVHATIAMARLVKNRQPRLFDYYFGLRHKQAVAELLSLTQPKIVLHVSGMLPVAEGCLAPVVPLLANPNNPSEIICYNLRFDPGNLLSLSAEQIHEKLYTPTLDLAEGEERLPLKGVHLNKSPALAPLSTLNHEQAEKWRVDLKQAESYWQQIQSAAGLQEKLWQVYQSEREFSPVDADGALYEDFISREDRHQCDLLLQSEPQQLTTWPMDTFRDARLQTLLLRYRARNYPQTLNPEEQRQWLEFCQRRLVDGESGSTLTIEQFQQQLLTLAQAHSGEREQHLLNQLSLWAQQLFD